MMWKWLGLIVLIPVLAFFAGCVRSSGGTWYVREAEVPEGWPTLTPVGEVEVKQYPEYRAAVVEDAGPDGGEQGSMFRTLFDHIKQNEIAMTAPVEMGYDASRPDTNTDREMRSMAFLYRSTEQGELDPDGQVVVRDLPAQTVASIGVRGGYTDERFNEHVATLDSWLEEHADAWERDGAPRYLGYNSPFVPAFMRYGEVQVPIRERAEK